MTTKTIEIYEKALCCETGVCGAEVDTELLRITAAAAELKGMDILLDRANLNSRPEKFVHNALVCSLLREQGVAVLPVTIIDGSVVKQRAYPTKEELESWTGVKLGGARVGCGCGSKGCR